VIDKTIPLEEIQIRIRSIEGREDTEESDRECFPMHIIIQFLCCWVDKGIQPEHI